MSEYPDPVLLTPASDALPQATAPPVMSDPVRTTGELWLELAIVLLIAVVPDLFASLWSMYWSSQSYESYSSAFNYAAQEGLVRQWPNLALVGRSVRVSAVVLYLMWRSRERWSEFGFSWPRWLLDLSLGSALYAVTLTFYYGGYYAYAWTCYLISPIPSSGEADTMGQNIAGMFPHPRSLPETLLFLAANCSNGFAEELAMRAYMIPRLERLLRSTWLSLLLSTVLFASYHTYQGGYGVFSALVFGMVYGGAFCVTRRIWPIVISHAIADIIGVLCSGG